MSRGGAPAANRDFVLEAWQVLTLPGLATVVTVLGAGLIGDGSSAALDPNRNGG